MRRRRHDVAVLERVADLARRHQTTDVRHVHHQHRAARVGDLAEARVVQVARVRRVASHDQLGLVDVGVLLQLVVVDQTRLLVHVVRQRLEEDRRARQRLAHLRLGVVGVVAVRQVTARGQVQTHDAAAGTQKTRVHSEVGRRAGVGLHVHAPLLGVQVVRGQSALLAQLLDLVDELVTAVVTVVGVTLGVLVGEAGAKALHDGSGGEVLHIKRGKGYRPQRRSFRGTSTVCSSPSRSFPPIRDQQLRGVLFRATRQTSSVEWIPTCISLLVRLSKDLMPFQKVETVLPPFRLRTTSTTNSTMIIDLDQWKSVTYSSLASSAAGFSAG